jgi:ACS family hexuronate transporter-like MFS transporter
VNAKAAARRRWFLCSLLFFATTVNYMDRQVLGLLKPVIGAELHWTESDYGWIVFCFQLAYAAMMPVAGRVVDWLGTRIGYALAVAVWSAAAMSHALARSTVQFAAARFGLGLGESGNFPSAVKAVADWFPPKDRAFATGVFNSGANLGAILAPLAVPMLAAHFGWRAGFLGTGALEVIWLAVWLSWYRHPSAEERPWADAKAAEAPAPSYGKLITTRPAWAFLLGKFLTDPVWWFYLFWLPAFLSARYGLRLTSLGPPLVAVYLAADAGSVLGGWLPARLMARGWRLNRARKTALLVCACATLPVTGVMAAGPRMWLSVALIALAAAGHQGWSANLYTLVSDTAPGRGVGSIVGLGGLGGAVGGMLAAPAIGAWLDFSHRFYGPLFVIAGSAYLIALAVIQSLVPKLPDRVRVEQE